MRLSTSSMNIQTLTLYICSECLQVGMMIKRRVVTGIAAVSAVGFDNSGSRCLLWVKPKNITRQT